MLITLSFSVHVKLLYRIVTYHNYTILPPYFQARCEHK